MTAVQTTISPVDERVYVERPYATAADIERTLAHAVKAQRAWKTTPIAERVRIANAFCAAFEKRRDAIAEEITWQMGRPLAAAPGEVRGTLERARHMAAIAEESLADIDAGPESRVQALRAPRAARRRADDRGLELPLPHRRQQRGACDPRGQRRDPQAFRPDAALRGAFCGML